MTLWDAEQRARLNQREQEAIARRFNATVDDLEICIAERDVARKENAVLRERCDRLEVALRRMVGLAPDRFTLRETIQMKRLFQKRDEGTLTADELTELERIVGRWQEVANVDAIAWTSALLAQTGAEGEPN